MSALRSFVKSSLLRFLRTMYNKHQCILQCVCIPRSGITGMMKNKKDGSGCSGSAMIGLKQAFIR